MICSNIVEKAMLNAVQLKTLKILKDSLINSFGPMGSNTVIKKQGKLNNYTKDGFTILQNIVFNGPIEDAVKEDITESTRYVVRTVGDGTTSTVILSQLIFEAIIGLKTEKDTLLIDEYPPVVIANSISAAVKNISTTIKTKKQDVTIDDIYNISLISTNGNTEVANGIKEVYKTYGMDVFVDVNVSSSTDTYTKSYDGMTLNSGMDDPCYVNVTGKDVCSIRNPKIYAFRDPIDTQEMIALFDTIISKNIIEPAGNNAAMQADPKAKRLKLTPTVILAPRISADMSAYIKRLVDYMRALPIDDKPPLLIISNIHNQDLFDDITMMCGVKMITKYIDPKLQEADINSGLAPSPKNVVLFCGSADLVEADTNKTKFINPSNMLNEDRTPTTMYSNLLSFLEDSLKEAQKSGADANITGVLKRRINGLKCNMVEFYIGGITAADRDATRALVEDAVLNCRSAAINGVGFGANFEGLLAAINYDACMKRTTLDNIIGKVFKESYIELLKILYRSAIKDEDAVTELFKTSISKKMPYNIRTTEFDGSVLSSLDTDVVILETIDKILSIMVTSNQFLVPSPQFNTYIDNDKL